MTLYEIIDGQLVVNHQYRDNLGQRSVLKEALQLQQCPGYSYGILMLLIMIGMYLHGGPIIIGLQQGGYGMLQDIKD